MELSSANVAHSKCQHWRGWRGQERERSCIRFYNSVERYFKMVSFLITRKSYEINLCFVQRPWQSAVYIFKKIESKRRLIWRPRNGLWYGLHYGLHLLNCTFTVSVDEPETVSYHIIRWPTFISYSTVCSFWLENLTTPSLERFTLCKQVPSVVPYFTMMKHFSPFFFKTDTVL